VDYKNDEIIVSFVKWGDPSVEYQAVRHLESGYKEIYREYVSMLEYSNLKKIQEIKKKLQEYRDTVEQKLKQTQIPVTEIFIDFKTKRYNKKFVKTSIFNENKDGKYGELVIDPPVFDLDLPSLRWGETIFAVGDMTSLQDLKNTIEKIRNDKEIINIIMDIESKKIQLKNNTALERFNHRTEEIITQVRIERKPLYGKCDDGRCY
jgi:hypothetical protein